MVDETLVERIREGDVEALGQFLELHRQELLGFVQHVSRPELQQVVPAEDLFQEVATSAISSLSRLASPELDPLSWLRQLARRRVVDAHRFHFQAARRSQGRQRSLQGNNDASSGWEAMIVASMTSPSQVLSRNQRLSRLQVAIQELGTEAEQAIRLRYVEGLSSREIAERMGKSDVAIRVMLSRSIQRLQGLLHVNQPPE